MFPDTHFLLLQSKEPFLAFLLLIGTVVFQKMSDIQEYAIIHNFPHHSGMLSLQSPKIFCLPSLHGINFALTLTAAILWWGPLPFLRISKVLT